MNVMVINLTINQTCFEREIEFKYIWPILYAIGIPYFSSHQNLILALFRIPQTIKITAQRFNTPLDSRQISLLV